MGMSIVESFQDDDYNPILGISAAFPEIYFPYRSAVGSIVICNNVMEATPLMPFI